MMLKVPPSVVLVVVLVTFALLFLEDEDSLLLGDDVSTVRSEVDGGEPSSSFLLTGVDAVARTAGVKGVLQNGTTYFL